MNGGTKNEQSSRLRLTGLTLGDIASIVMGQSPKGEQVNKRGVGLPLLNGPTEFGSNHPSPVQWAQCWTKEGRCQWVVAMSSLNASVGVR